ncbi:MAG: ATP synthase F1, alpha subunit, F-type H+-transporting ATPase subunit alpha [Candidatus Woesebacteria bacterium GW2011_GWC1_38_13]|uniref:ATP synthase subunit alpha n=4 Tax=Candidatus Woeseibacteriota TaxID=1752722 RepID=A0A0G0KSW8_9BACT|nr:MAG: ATP synthase subunit alpha [Candidatus Woesebacteria bacterium GW2011_GWD1_38_10]KKQ54984.1 MAG: ATP synthase F1, alpha subunit, F-type H+-transporting ATPase subunit alpha [Candidatus Woesebacteria bacterium GW2011_GWC1_38_13]KKQ76406.1 MAG: ATP synthase subunit alpha [Microgenomates group bacterium GW2011_GWF1_38_5]KKQ82778.1 MAG: ATP synthase subunit alpha [Candidatus Woesebacteria bacterium GW2011_GWA1_38_8]
MSNTDYKIRDEGTVISLADGVCWVSGIDTAKNAEVVKFDNDVSGMVLNLEEKKVGVLVLDFFEKLKRGDKCYTTGEVMKTGVGEDLLGRVIDPLGQVLDSGKPIDYKKFLPIEKIAPGIVARKSVDTPLQTGIKAVDAMIPIGRGQRELIIGDRSTGKTALTIDTIINQKDTGVISIYVAIGQKRSKIAQIIQKLKDFDVMKNTILVVASASDSVAMRYLAPYVGCTVGEYFMDKGKDVLVVYDDLSKHAWAYREVSLLLKRPSGREAYPGDVFYLHSRLLERACRLNEKNGGGSLTALPIIETQSGDVSAYIPTNVISITDGQIYLESDLFFAGVRPALNVGLSVSRVGGSAQNKAMKKVAGKLRLDLSQYWELATFAQFSSDLDVSTKEKIERGKRIIEVLKQPQYEPMPVEEEVVNVYLATSGGLDDVPVEEVKTVETQFIKFIREKHSKILKDIKEKKVFEESAEKELMDLLTEFKKDIVIEKN